MTSSAADSTTTDPVPYTPAETLWHHAWRRMRRSWSALLGLLLVAGLVLMAVTGPFVAPHDYRHLDPSPAAMRAAPSADAFFGKDDLGRDVFSRVLNGGRYTLGIGFATVLFGLVFGVPLGLVSGYFRGRVDQLVMRAADIVLALPDYLLALAIMAVLGPSLQNAMLAVGTSFVPKFARVVRASALQQSGLEYVLAARALGAGHGHIIVRHLLPNCLAPLLVVSTLSLGTAILYTSSLSFLGLGAQPPLPEWGAMLSEGKEAYQSAPHLMLFPGAAIALSVLGINLLGDGLRDALDVRLK